MLLSRAVAPGKIILFGEHAVVYGQPAIAAPVTQAQAVCEIETAPHLDGLTIAAPDIGRRYRLEEAPPDDPLAVAVRRTLAELNIASPPDLLLTVRSTIPVACGLGSGAAVSTAVILALGRYCGRELPPQTVSDWVFEVEKIHHGTPSGIDNTVIAFTQPIFFRKGQAIERLNVHTPLTFIIADTGVKSATYKVVGDLRARRQAEPARYDPDFEAIGGIARQARQAIETGDIAGVADCMRKNQRLLRKIGVSSMELDRLVTAGEQAGALGAKLSGAGWGGNMIALATPETAQPVAEALLNAGAARTIITQVT